MHAALLRLRVALLTQVILEEKHRIIRGFILVSEYY